MGEMEVRVGETEVVVRVEAWELDTTEQAGT